MLVSISEFEHLLLVILNQEAYFYDNNTSMWNPLSVFSFGIQKHLSRDLEDSSSSSTQGKFNREQFYKFIIFPGKWIKVWYDRLTLLALLDR